MPISCGAQILRGHVQINLRASDLSVTEKIANGNDLRAGANQMRCECVAQAVR